MIMGRDRGVSAEEGKRGGQGNWGEGRGKGRKGDEQWEGQ